MFVSVIVPAYQIKNYLERCIHSVTCLSFNDYEIIIVDDGSYDGTELVADNLAKSDLNNKIRVIHQSNKGLSGARNTGIKEAVGDYILFLDGDDMLFPDSLKVLSDVVEQTKADIVCFGYEEVLEKNLHSLLVNGEIKGKQRLETKPIFVSKKEYVLNCGIAVWNKLYKRSLFDNQDLFFPEKKIYEDLATTPKFILYTSNIVVIYNSLYLYIQRHGSIMSSPKIDRIFEAHKGYDGVLKLFKTSKQFEEFYSELEWLAILHCYYYTVTRALYIGLPKKKVMQRIEAYISRRFPDYANNKYLSEHKNNDHERFLQDVISKKYLKVALLSNWRHYIKVMVFKLLKKEYK